MSALITQVATLRRLARAYRRILTVAVPAALAGCQGATDSLGPAEPRDPAASATETAPATAPATGDLAALTGLRIAFMSRRFNSSPNVFTMDPTGKNVVRLSGWTGQVDSPTLSYDNKRLAVARWRYDPVANVTRDDIYLMNADGSNQRWARGAPSNFDIRDPSWSPDGVHLVVSVQLSTGSFLAQLNTVTGDLAFVSPQAGGPIGRWASYDPTGKKIVYIGKDARSIERINADGTGHVILFSSTTSEYHSPVYSPDGKRLAFVKSVSGDLELFVKNPDGSVKRLTTSKYYDVDPSWSPDGSKIFFASARSGVGQIYSMSASGGTATRLSFSSAGDWHPLSWH
jgi:Tol biopolymer transport system component